MSAGCAIVASSVGLTSSVGGEEIGVLVEFDAAAIAGAVLTLLDRPAVAAQMGKAARARVLAEHNVAEYVEYLNDVHNMVSAGGVGSSTSTTQHVHAGQ
jgi:glycosyltransferase involved in cell wall biosynthesis